MTQLVEFLQENRFDFTRMTGGIAVTENDEAYDKIIDFLFKSEIELDYYWQVDDMVLHIEFVN